MKNLLLAVVLSVALLGAPAQSQARSCSIGNSGVTYNRGGIPAKFEALQAFKGMNCKSARYVLNRWLRRAYARTTTYQLPRKFFDGYVTWRCSRLSRLNWRCEGGDSDTVFRFRAYRF